MADKKEKRNSFGGSPGRVPSFSKGSAKVIGSLRKRLSSLSTRSDLSSIKDFDKADNASAISDSPRSSVILDPSDSNALSGAVMTSYAVPVLPQTPESEDSTSQLEGDLATPTLPPKSTEAILNGTSVNGGQGSNQLNPNATAFVPPASADQPSIYGHISSASDRTGNDAHRELEPHPPAFVPPASFGFPAVDQLASQSHDLPNQAQSQQPTAKSSIVHLRPDSASSSAQSASSNESIENADIPSNGFRKPWVASPGLIESSRDHPDDPSDTSESLTVSFWRNWRNASITPGRKFWLVAASVGINLVLPFLNGIFLGIGEIVAREWMAITFGFGKSQRSIPENRKGNTTGLGLRSAGVPKERPSHAAAKTMAEGAVEAAI